MTLPAPIRSAWLDGDACAHGFFTRKGGVSSGIFASLNVGFGTGDDVQNVSENRKRVAVALDTNPAPLATPYQVHSADAVVATAGWEKQERPKADAVVTDRPGVVLGVLTADCGPVLFADLRAGVIGAAHAGWRGASSGVLQSAVQAMEGLGAKRGDIHAVLGPTIRKENYEVGPEFVARFVETDRANSQYFAPSPRPGHAMFDLPGYILTKLAALDVDARETGQCTYENDEDFFSYRRMTHFGEADYGRQISAIALKG